ncbi:phosphoadenylyl-sulfate reductase [Virgibacillus kekensis]|uniref:Adenosine 5'-phosphosulfate reductase n=1 Tax=Virgibacillus kekensis TaxID=202261 RepID=A0ABV9DM47_9BACI
MLTYKDWDEKVQTDLNNQLKDFMHVIRWAFEEYQNKIIYACSFGAEGVVLLDLIAKVNSKAKIVFLDTELHFQETYNLIEKIKDRYPDLHINMVKPELTLEQQAEEHGEKLWKKDPNLCCSIRKIKPLEKALSEAEAWFSGLRREQSLSRRKTEYINRDDRFKKIKICPLIHWSWDDVWTYIELNDLPYNELHDQNYPSIGCAMCTLPVEEKADSRAGRWANFNKKECGLHQT